MIVTRLVHSVPVLDLRGAVTATHPDSGLRRAIRAALEQGARVVVVNLAHVTTIDSSGVADLAASHTMVAGLGGRLAFCNPTPKLKDVFATTRLNTVLDLYDTEDDALAAVGPG
ncbi:MAG TPA: STAS domain-containing protein [Vicinamibacterales bacterium]|nr:STAS domain-containing protein [Vicinamibacterales bacterium]